MEFSHRTVDADRHVIEPIELWRSHLDPVLREHAPYYQHLDTPDALRDRVVRFGERGRVRLPAMLMLDGRPVWDTMPERTQVELARAGQARRSDVVSGTSPESQLCAMDRDHVDIAFLFPTFAHYILAIDTMDPSLSCAFSRAYNDWLRVFCSADPARLRGVGVVSRHDPSEMVSELHRIVDFGWLAVVLRPNPIRGRTLASPDYEPFWTECERLSVAVAIHEGTHARAPTAGADRFESRFGRHACSHPMEQMMAFLSLLEGGVFERHPGLRVGFLEAGCGWVPYWLWRLDAVEFNHLAGEVQDNVRISPSAYFRRQCFVSAEADEPCLAGLVQQIGEDNVLFGTDFPHLDHDSSTVERTFAPAQLAPHVLERILWSNPARFYGLEGACR